jgi:hypothetical protein
MNALVAIFTELLTSLNQTLRLSASFPALLFVAANVVLVQRYFKFSLFDPFFGNSSPLGIAVCSALALLTAFTLSSLNGPIVKLLEGHSLRRFWLGRWLMEAHIERLHWLRQEERRLRGRIARFAGGAEDYMERLDGNPTSRDEFREYLRATVDLGNAVVEMRDYFPTKEHLVLPTRLGNAIAAFEDYPNWRYGIDAVALWPRLVPILKKTGYAHTVERYKTAFDFFLNMAMLSTLFGLEIAYTIAYFEGRLPVIEVGITVLVMWTFYQFTTAVAINWGETVRVAFDLFRHQLRGSLRLRKPYEYEREVELWQRYSAFLRDPEAAPHRGDLVYDKRPEELE